MNRKWGYESFVWALIVVVLALASVVGSAIESAPEHDFEGLHDDGVKVHCKYLGKHEALVRYHFACRFDGDIKAIAAYGAQTNVKTWCEVVDGKVKMFDCVSGTADFAHYYLKTDASPTGLISCRYASAPIKGGEDTICAISHNPQAGYFGTSKYRKNVATCIDHKDRTVLIDQITENNVSGSPLKAGDYAVIVATEDTKVVLTKDRASKSDEKAALRFSSEEGRFELFIPKEGKEGDVFIGSSKLLDDKIHFRMKCVRGSAS